MTLRAATATDLGPIMTLERSSFPADAWSEAMMAAELASPHGRYLVDIEGGAVVGYGGVRVVAGSADSDIQTIALAADVRGHGRGRALLRELLRTARERGARETFLEVRADNPVARALYASEGFVEVGHRPRYYQPDDVDAVVMRLDLVGWSASHRLSDSEDIAGFGPSAPRHPNPAPVSESAALGEDRS
ncbi:ribosomal protein S18-alanine N-acetyltransferase [Microbacterium sp.]|uniref:ribosomal protein S18-alanine N-acetyltransferase n=1 Tax=Microbacterium sp. TaxID=51671 RepID=UPI003A89B900